MNTITVNENIKLVPYFENYDTTLKWYEDKDVCKEFQNKHIGRNCVKKILELAKENGLKSVTANIYAFNHQSRKMFEAVGFKQIDEELFEYKF